MDCLSLPFTRQVSQTFGSEPAQVPFYALFAFFAVDRKCRFKAESNGVSPKPGLGSKVWGRPPVCRFTESLTPCPSGRWNTGPEARLTGRPEVCPTFRPE